MEDIDQYYNILQKVVLNWDTVSMEIDKIDPKSRSYQIFREMYRSEDDSMIRARALSFLIFMAYSINE